MADSEVQFLQQAQDLLSDLCGIPMALFKYAPFGESLTQLKSPTKWQKSYNTARVTRWSLNHALFRFLEGHPPLLKELLQAFHLSLLKIDKNAKQGVWKPVIFRGLLKCRWFILPITELQAGEDPKKQKRKIRYLLCGGPVARAATSDWQSLWQDIEALETNNAPFAKTLQYQLIPELLEVPPWKGEESFREEELVFELNTVRMTLNGVVRDLLKLVRLQRYDLMAGIYELLRLTAQREHLKRGLAGLSKLLPGTRAVAVVLRNPVTKSGFLALHVPSYTEERKTQLLLIPLPDDTDAYFNSTRFDQTPETDRKFLDLPVSDQYSARLNWPTDTLNVFAAVWFFGESERAVTQLVKRARGPLVDAFLNGWLPAFNVSKPRINRRVSQAQQQSAHHTRHEIANLVASSEFLPQKDIQRLLCDVQTLIGAERVDYFRPRLHEPNSDGGVSAKWFAGSPERTAGKEPLVITELMVDHLFNQKNPYIPSEQSLAIIPVISANRTLGLLRFGFRENKELQNTMPAMIELSCRLGIRVPYRRLLELIKNIMKQMTQTEQVDWQALAGDIAFLFGESACSIWEHNKNERKFERLAIVGSDHALREIPDDEAKQSLIGVCLNKHSTVVVNLEEPGSAVQVLMKDELLKRGFKHGVVAAGKASSDAPLSLLVTLWSKTHFRTDHFSSDDQSTLSFLALIMLQMLSVRHLVRAQRETHDAVLTGLGHEIGAPLAAFYDALSLFSSSRRLRNMKSLVEYTQELINGLLIFAQIEGLSSRPKETEPRPLIPVKPFEDLIYPIESVMHFLIQGKGLTLEHHFEPSEFPTALQVPEGEDRYLRNIIFNLLSNTVKYSLSTNRLIRIIGKVTALGVEVRVQNFGIGVPKGEEDLIFKREQRGSNAFQTAAVGSGMGLYISRKLAKLLGGDVFLARRADPTEFVVQLPIELAVF